MRYYELGFYFTHLCSKMHIILAPLLVVVGLSSISPETPPEGCIEKKSQTNEADALLVCGDNHPLVVKTDNGCIIMFTDPGSTLAIKQGVEKINNVDENIIG